MTGPAPLPLALTMGEPAGIGGEIALKAWLEREKNATPAFFVIDDPMRLELVARRIGLDVPIRAISDPEQATGVFATAVPVLVQSLASGVSPGKPDPANGAAVIGAVERAVELAANRRAGAVVTNPIHKATLYKSGFRYPGHTELLAALAGPGTTPVMMLTCPTLRVVPVTRHVSLRKAVSSLKAELIVEVGNAVHKALILDFGIKRPRIAVAALNPHAGESGSMGQEEINAIAPAVEKLRAVGIAALGPAPADTLFHDAARERYDAVLCMYHDQALIPLKTIDFEGGINITLGLPFVRTSPDHGTAFQIAGTGQASAASLSAALSTAANIAANRAKAEKRGGLPG